MANELTNVNLNAVGHSVKDESLEKVVNGINTKVDTKGAAALTSDEYSSTKAYTSGQYCIFNNALYKCKVASSSGNLPTDTTYWTKVSVGSELKDANTNLGVLSEKIGTLGIGTETYHNAIYVKKDITSWFKDGSLWTRIKNDFEGIYPGMYFDCGKAINGGTSQILIVGCNVHWNTSGGMRYNHITCVPVSHFGIARMNDSAVTTGGYLGSKMNTDVIGPVAKEGKADGTINEQLLAVFGSHLKISKELLSNDVNTTGYNRFGNNDGCSSGWTLQSVQAVLMSEVEVYGSIAWSSSGYDTGSAKVQMPAFRFNTNDMNINGGVYWLKDVASSTRFCHYDEGNASYSSARSTMHVRPRFILG